MPRIHRTSVLLFGKYSRMLDMGGMGTAESKHQVLDMGKNNKVKSIALDFNLISRSIEKAREERQKDVGGKMVSSPSSVAKSSSTIHPSKVKPNVSLVQSIANLLDVKLGDDDNSPKIKLKDTGEDDDLSALENLGEKNSTKKRSTTKAPPFMDIRSKYADKIKKTLEGGSGSLAGLDRMKEERNQALKHGDAASHIAARHIAASQSVMTSGSKWLATTGTGALLTYLTSRSMNISLLPMPQHEGDQVGKDMETLTKQLPNVRFHSLLKNGDKNASDILSDLMGKLHGIEELSVLVVSDRDDYLSSARQKGMYTCRVRPPNTRRGNSTSDYTVEAVADIEQVVNEINGISFNSVLSG